MIPDRRDLVLLRLAGKYRWLPFGKLSKFGFESISDDVLALTKFGLMGVSRNRQYIKPSPRGYILLRELGYDCDTSARRAYANSSVLRRRLETSEIMLTCLRAGIDTLQDEVDALRSQPVFFPAFAFRSADTNMLSNCCCAGFGHWGNAAYMLHYVSPESKGMFFTNELKIFHNLASVFSDHLNTPSAMIFAGDSYKKVYEQVTARSLSKRHGARGFIDFSEVYRRAELPIHLLSCDETGAVQLALMRQPDYTERIARASFGSRWAPYDDMFPETDGVVDGDRPLIIAVDMNIRRVGRVIADAKRFGKKQVLLAALKSQMEDLLMEAFPRDGMTVHLEIERPILDAAFGKDFSLYSMDNKDTDPEGREPYA